MSGGANGKADVVAAIQARAQTLDLPDWPVFGLAGEPEVWLAGAGEGPDGLLSVRLDYRPPWEVSRLIVQTQRIGGQGVTWPQCSSR